eukprot:UN33345
MIPTDGPQVNLYKTLTFYVDAFTKKMVYFYGEYETYDLDALRQRVYDLKDDQYETSFLKVIHELRNKNEEKHCVQPISINGKRTTKFVWRKNGRMMIQKLFHT